MTRAESKDFDRVALEQFHVPGILLMENAARGSADIALQMLAGKINPRVLLACGPGNNGGDGFAIARHLHLAGAAVRVLPMAKEWKGDAGINWQIVQAMQLPIASPEDELQADLIIDALFGVGLSRAIEGEHAKLIDRMNASGVPILAIDVPSGLDADTGDPLGPCVRAAKTVTFVAEKTGFANPASRPYTGDVTVLQIGFVWSPLSPGQG